MPNPPSYLFVPQEQKIREEYEQWKTVAEIFPVTSVGIVTARDALTVHFTAEEAWNTITSFASLSEDAARTTYKLGPDARDWKVSLAQNDVKASGPTKSKLVLMLYRPFDTRHTYYTGTTRGILCMPRTNVMRNMLGGENLALITARSNKSEHQDHFLVTDKIMETKCGEATTQSAIFPLYIYPTQSERQFGMERKGNLNPASVKEIAVRIGEEPTPEDVFYYIYAILYAPTYRARYADFLKRDFPRIPLPPEAETFKMGTEVGAKLVILHLLEDPALNNTGITFPKAGTGTVEKMRADKRYIPPANGNSGYVRLNDTQYFGNVPPEAWAFRVGGYQPAFKWLDDRAGRTLTEDDINHYRRMLAAMRDTIPLQSAADQVFGRVLDAAASVP